MNPIHYFKAVRDIPYRIPTTPEEADHSCYTKHLLLSECLKNTGIKVRPRICEFNWSDLSPIPTEVLDTPHEDRAYHLYLEFKNNGIWKPIDATIDQGLEGTLKVNEWDGKSATKVAVPARHTYSPIESKIMVNAGFNVEEHLSKNAEFYKALNGWLTIIRNND